MILLTLTFLGLGITDLILWTAGQASRTRRVAAIFGATGICTAGGALAGFSQSGVLATGIAGLVVIGTWVVLDPPSRDSGAQEISKRRIGLSLGFVITVPTLLFVVSGTADPVGGSLARWYSNLGFSLEKHFSVDQFLLAVGLAVFLLATANRVVRLVLDSAVDSWERTATKVTGGRLIGPMERLILAAVVLSGDAAAAALIITAKGLLRFPEIRDFDEKGKAGRAGPDSATEYLLVGTFTSLLLAAIAAALLLAAT